MRNNKKIITPVLIFTFAFIFPISTWAQSALDEVPPVPIADKAMRAKEVGITVYGYTLCVPATSLCVTLDSITTTVAKMILQVVVSDTLIWINSGFQGNPAYATNPAQYFTKIADGVAGKFIEGSDLAFLCSPFQANIRLALTKFYLDKPQFQCTLTGIIANIDAFYDSFGEGGWDGWFVMTQNDSNNPYGVYLEAQVELDKRLAKILGLKDKQLKWNSGFLSWSECLENNPDTGECMTEDAVVTPGKVIEAQLEGVLGTGVRQLELVDEVDEIVGALFTQLLQQVVFGAKGLFSSEAENYGGGGDGGSGPIFFTLNVYKSGTGVGTLTSLPVGIDCGTDCSADYPKDTVVTLTASSTASSTFTGWFGGVCPNATSTTCALQMLANTNITAIFDK